MKKKQEGFVQIPFLIAIVIGVVVTSGVGVTFVEYKNISNKIAQSDQLSAEENYNAAIEVLNLTKKSWIVNTLGVKSDLIKNDLDEAKTRHEHHVIYQKALDQLGKKELEEAITSFSEIPDDSFYYQKAQLKIEESKRGVVEGKLEKEQVARGAAEQKTKQEIQARKIAEGKTIGEASKRASAEQVATNERLAKEQQQQETAFQTQARKEAEQTATNERLAKEQQQLETAAQKQRAEQEEKAKILELTKTQPVIRAIVNGDLKFYVYPLPSYAATGVSKAVEDIATTLSSWSPYEAIIKRVYSPNDADLTISWIKDYGSEVLGQAIFRAHLEVGIGSNNCLGEWSAFDSNTVKKILWHELGHSMGYGHSNNSNNIMYSGMNTYFEVESEISKVIPGGYFITQPLCSSGGYSYGFKTDSPTTGFNLFVLSPGVDPKSFSEESSSFYLGCGAKGMQSYPGSCVVDSGSKIYIENTSVSNAIKLSGTVINTNQSLWPDMTWDKNAYQYDTGELIKIWNLFH